MTWGKVDGSLAFHRYSGIAAVAELCLAEGWIGIPCFQVRSGQNVLDEAKARRIRRVTSGTDHVTGAGSSRRSPKSVCELVGWG